MSKKEFDKQIKNELLHKTPESLVELYLQAKWELGLKEAQIEEQQEKISELMKADEHYSSTSIKYLNEIIGLKQQLEELPKKICDEIFSAITSYEKYYLEFPEVNRAIKEIQAKYEKEVKGESDE